MDTEIYPKRVCKQKILLTMKSLGTMTFKRENGVQGDDISENEYLGEIQNKWPLEEMVLRKEQFIMSNAKGRPSKIRNKNDILEFKIRIWYHKLAGKRLARIEGVEDQVTV